MNSDAATDPCEQGFAELADLLPDALLLASAQGDILCVNRAAVELLGVPAARLIGRRLHDWPADGSERTAELLRMASRSRQALPGVMTLPTGTGELQAYRCMAAAYRRRTATTPAWVLLRIMSQEAAVHEFTELNQRIDELSKEVARRRRAESALFANSERLRVTLSSIGDAVIATDARGHVTLMNPIAQRLTGWSFEDAGGRDLDEVFVIINEHTRAPVESPVSKVLREGTVVGLANHTLLLSRNGDETPIADSAAPIRGDDGTLLGIVMVFSDVTERHAMEAELRRKSMRLEEADRRKNEFLSMLAHELRNPLAPLQNGVHLLRRASDGDIGRISAMLQRQVSHMTRLIEDLLDVARVTRGSIELRKTAVSLTQVLDQALEMSRPLIDARGHRLTLHATPAERFVLADGTRMVQVFGNLLSNAAKFTPPGGRIDLSVEAHGDVATVTVADNGEGIDPALLPELFELFVQGDRSLDRPQGGLGIGLTVVRAIVSMHGGSVSASSDGRGRGSTFVVRMPLLLDPSLAAPAASAPAAGSLASRGGLQILIVDDNQDAADSLAAILDNWGHTVRCLTEGRCALDVVIETKPDCVLLDIGLPGMDGYEIARAIRGDLRCAGLPLIAVTGYGEPAAREASREAGFDHHLTKPVDLELLRELLHADPTIAPARAP